MRKSLYITLISFFLLIAVFSGMKIHSHFKEAQKQDELYENLSQIVEQAETVPETEPIPEAEANTPTAPTES